MSLIKRNERGKLTFNHLDMMLYFDELFEHCEDSKEVDWLYEQLQSYLEGSYEEKYEELINRDEEE